jgi:hypothetical protein
MGRRKYITPEEMLIEKGLLEGITEKQMKGYLKEPAVTARRCRKEKGANCNGTAFTRGVYEKYFAG